MICRITGTITSVEPPAIVLEIEGQGLSYEILTPAYLAAQLANQVGQRVTLITIQYLESQGQGSSFIPRLIGFQHASDRRFFEVFITVKGIGNRKALRAMAIEPARIARAITSRDAAALKELPEIGKRLADTIVAELTGKVDAFLSSSEIESLDAAIKPARALASGPHEEAIEILVALGETREQADRRVSLALSRAAVKGHQEPTAAQLVDMVFGST